MNLKGTLRRQWYRLFREHPYRYLGRLVIPLCPRSLLNRVQDDFLINPEHQSLGRKIIKAGLSSSYFAQDDTTIAHANRAQFWGGAAGRRWHQMKAQRLRDAEVFRLEFEEFRAPVVRQLRALIAADRRLTMLCEIGTGNGLFLQYLSQTPGFESIRFVGIDLNVDQIRENQAILATHRLTFEHAEVLDWIHTRCRGGTIFLTHDTLHNFTPTELRQLLEAIGRFEATALVLSEPVDTALTADVLSRPRGGIGISFSHNYSLHLDQCGFQVVSHEIFESDRLPVYDHRVIVARPRGSLAAVGQGRARGSARESSGRPR